MKSYTCKIVLRRSRMFSVIIEASGDTTLDQLHHAIQDALEWGADHLYSFFMNGKAWDRETEYSAYDCEEDMPMPRSRDSRRVGLKSLGMKAGDRFLYLFDYGNCHEFDNEILRISTVKGKGSRQVIVERGGALPQQYPQMGDWGVSRDRDHR